MVEQSARWPALSGSRLIWQNVYAERLLVEERVNIVLAGALAQNVIDI